MRRSLFAPLAIAAAVALAGCSYGSPVPDADVFACSEGATNTACPEIGTVDFDGMLAEWEAHVATLELPAGAELQPPRESDLGDEEQGYEEGFGESVAHHQVMCAWKGEWLVLEDKQSPEAVDAIEYLRGLVETDESTSDSLAPMRDLDAAAGGDPDGLQSDYDLNCAVPA
ncbi:hypothetical protein [Labedella endophytica]|uniref:DUF3558 domain-containing protein n=1 Tax=Labedella endophytica TaxID=1523160 RepID=A0A3S0X8J0_9MICO|nr:hypothetical protein [Labedella endophytica]RUQ98200.1 hypothetical protein ELQ94_14365 [Labedella endophytica]